MTKKVHNTVWRAPDASNVGLDHLKPGFQQVAELLFFQYAGILPYKSRDMQVGIYTGSLVVFAQFIRHCILVDGRGGYFLQQDMEVMYESVANDHKYKAAFECAACNDKKTTEEFRYDQAYCLRVMLSHFRLKYDAWKKAKKGIHLPLHGHTLRNCRSCTKLWTSISKMSRQRRKRIHFSCSAASQARRNPHRSMKTRFAGRFYIVSIQRSEFHIAG
jgi:hypothetical protein